MRRVISTPCVTLSKLLMIAVQGGLHLHRAAGGDGKARNAVGARAIAERGARRESPLEGYGLSVLLAGALEVTEKPFAIMKSASTCVVGAMGVAPGFAFGMS